jgi:DNA-binding transcriptional LysR family regulator
MAITFRKLEVFVAAAEDCNFRRTAERLGISQPSVSTQVRGIEQSLGCSLFHRRTGAAVTLSAQGRAYLPRARELLEAGAALTGGRLRQESAALRVCAGPLLLEGCIKPALPAMHARHPGLDLEFIAFDPSRDPLDLLRGDEVDVVVYTGGLARGGRIEAEVLGQVQTGLYASPSLLRQARRAGRDLAQMPFLLPPDRQQLSRWQRELLAGARVTPRDVVARPAFQDVALQMAVAGQGVAVLFADIAEPAVQAGTLQRIEPALAPSWRVMLIGEGGRRAAVAPVLGFLRETCRPRAV